ncbi:expressed unknown protein [Ectocarpus siliculosus]|uniref:Uncharacterized protein n=1 Tax=Ectocarpus siliculosus TaxID=2880 RepID=D7FIC6_ECTSI|nr:expressed unknown protein [Ectocarpus siliculosus]|eukprot:CBJ28750.1 expressed unknown protein [Ectocarpus siliculosus]
MPGFMDGEGAKARQVAIRKILDDKQFGEDPGKNWSESESSDDDNGKDAPMSSGSSNNVSVEESTAPSDIGSQESGDVDSGDVESGDIVFAKEIREATFGGGGAGRKKNHGKRKASAGGSAVGNMNSTKASLGASAKKARGKDYPLWAAHLLRRTCAHRKIPRMSKEGDKHVLVQALRSHDGNMNRPCPYYDDLNAITAGKSGRRNGEEDEEEGAIPAKALLTFRNVVGMVAIARDSNVPFQVDNVEYSVADLYDALAKEDEAGKGDSAGGSTPTGGSSTGGAAGPDGDGSVGGSGSNTERKGPHCMMRLVGILCEDAIRPLLIESRLQATRQDLDTSSVGPRNELWTEVTARFRDPDHQVRKIVDDEQVSHVDPNIIQQPNISAEKLSRMWATAKAKWNQPYANWKSESGNNQPWLSFCQGCTDTYVLGCAIEKYPELNQVCNNLLPEGAQREDDGTGEGIVGTGGADRRAAAKREGARLHEQNRRGKKQKNKGVGQSVAEATSAAMKTAIKDMEPLLEKVGGSEKSEWYKKKEEHACKTAEHDSKASGLALQKEMTESHAEFSKKIVEEEKEKEAGYQTRVRFLRKMLAGIEKEMFGDE